MTNKTITIVEIHVSEFDSSVNIETSVYDVKKIDAEFVYLNEFTREQVEEDQLREVVPGQAYEYWSFLPEEQARARAFFILRGKLEGEIADKRHIIAQLKGK